jgi:hypothetical protein
VKKQQEPYVNDKPDIRVEKKDGDVTTHYKYFNGRETKKKVAMLVGYNGNDFFGSCIQHDLRTVELELDDALNRIGSIKDSNHNNFGKIGF